MVEGRVQKVPLCTIVPPLAGGRWCRKAPKGGRALGARRLCRRVVFAGAQRGWEKFRRFRGEGGGWRRILYPPFPQEGNSVGEGEQEHVFYDFSDLSPPLRGAPSSGRGLA